MKKYLAFSYWLERMPGTPDVRFWRILFFFAAACIIAGIIMIVLAYRRGIDGLTRRLLLKLTTWSLSTGLVTAILGFFRYQNALFLSMRLWILLWFLIAFIWLLTIVRYWLLVIPRRRAEQRERNEFMKYLPQKK